MLTHKILVLFSILCFSMVSWCDDNLSKETIKSTLLTPSLYMLEGAGGNITASVGSDGVLLVDDDFPEMSEKILAKLKELKGKSPRYIVNTHFHYDHTGGNKAFGKTSTIIAAAEVRERLAQIQKLWGKDHQAYPPEALPTLTFDKELKIHFNQQKIDVVHLVHGHTDGDTVVFFDGGNVVSMGDLYFSEMYPIFHPEHEGSLDGFIENIKLILERLPKNAKIVPGHGPLAKKDDLDRYYKMIVTSRTRVKAEIDKGLSLEQIQKTGLPAECEEFSHGYLTTDRWIALVYKGLKNSQ